MGGGSSVSSSTKSSPIIRVINFETFKQCGSFPRYPNRADLCVNLSTVNRDNSIIIFISHSWLRASADASGFDPKTGPHPDTPDANNYNLCVSGIAKVVENFAPGMENCYIWMDFGCIDQDTLPIGEVRQFIEIIKSVDCMFTPIYGTAEVKTNRVINWYEEYCAEAWTRYLSRAWCRAEMMFSAFVPIYNCPEARKAKFAGALKTFVSHGARPHLLYGNREDRARGLPTVLSPLEPAMCGKLTPASGALTRAEDKDRIKELVQALKSYLALAQKSAAVPALRNEMRNGKDTLKLPNGDSYTGDFVNDVPNSTKGHIEYASGDVYDGEIVNGKKHGRGVLKYENGDVYQGRFVDDLRCGKGILNVGGDVYHCEFVDDCTHGQGRLKFGNGDVYEGAFTQGEQTGYGSLRFSDSRNNVYEGQFLNGLMHGKGKLRLADGNCYEGEYHEGAMHGRGKFVYSDGNVYEGEWSEGMMNGKGVFTYSEGNVFEGEFVEGMMNGKGKMKFSDGCEYVGNFADGSQSGEGMMVWPNDTSYDGEWQDDQMTRGVLCVGSDNYSAEFSDGNNMVNGIRVYKVKLSNADGTLVRECKFKNGKLLDLDGE